MIAHPKFLFFDSGVFNSIRPKGPLDHPELTPGTSVETLFYQQVRALDDYHNLEYSTFYWRIQGRDQVDFVLYGPRGIHSFELKHAKRVRSEDAAGLKLFLHDYPSAKCHLSHLCNDEYNEGGISVMPLETALRRFVEISRLGSSALTSSTSIIMERAGATERVKPVQNSFPIRSKILIKQPRLRYGSFPLWGATVSKLPLATPGYPHQQISTTWFANITSELIDLLIHPRVSGISTNRLGPSL